MLAWNVFQHFYPYFDVVGADWGKELEIALRTAATDATMPPSTGRSIVWSCSCMTAMPI